MRPKAIAALAGAVAALAPAAPASANAPAGSAARHAVVVGHAALDVRCGPAGSRLDADWYFPATAARAATGIVWVQHGFLRTKRNVAGLARAIAARTGAIAVAPTISSNPFAAGGCWINGPPMQRAVADLFARRAALRRSAAAALGRRVRLPRAFVLTGHSAGGNLATAAAGYATLPGGAIADLRAVVLFDAVDSAGAMRAALDRLTGADDRPVLQIAAPDSPCNAFGAGTRALVAARPGRFVGVQLVGGTHVDAEGADSDALAQAVCGRPLPANVAAVRSIAAGWITDALTGSAVGISGVPGERIRVGGATAVVLPVG